MIHLYADDHKDRLPYIPPPQHSRGDGTAYISGGPGPSYDQEISVAAANANEFSWASHIEDFRAVRTATLTFFRNLPAEAWSRRGIASDNPFTVRALAYIIAGHVVHHRTITEERYL